MVEVFCGLPENPDADHEVGTASPALSHGGRLLALDHLCTAASSVLVNPHVDESRFPFQVIGSQK